jgi:hypothetical protein
LTEFATGVGEDVGGNVCLGNKRFAYIDGTCEVQLPSGPIAIEVSKGFEYAPIKKEVLLKQGQMSLRLELERWTDARKDGWFSGDARTHFLTPQAALLEAAAEDVAIVNLLALDHSYRDKDGTDHLSFSNILSFSGQEPALEKSGHLVVVNTLNRHDMLGSLGLLNCHRPVYPLHRDGLESADDWTLGDWCDQCHRKEGLVVWAEHDRTRQSTGGLWGEPLADLFLGKIDALETDFDEVGSEDRWWDGLLSCGIRLPLVGASVKDSNRKAVGAVRTYARLRPGEQLTYKSWIEAVRAGRSYVTNGPLLSFTVEDQDPGTLIDLPSTDNTLHIRAECRSWLPLNKLHVLLNGESVAVARASGSPSVASVELELSTRTSGWIRVLCEGPRDPIEGRMVQAFSSPVFVQVHGHPCQPKRSTVRQIEERLDAMLEWVHTKGRLGNDKQGDRLAGIFIAAKEELARRTRA